MGEGYLLPECLPFLSFAGLSFGRDFIGHRRCGSFIGIENAFIAGNPHPVPMHNAISTDLIPLITHRHCDDIIPAMWRREAMPLRQFSFRGLRLAKLDLSIHGIHGYQLNGALDLSFANLGAMDMTGFTGAGIDLAGIDFRHCHNLVGGQLNGAADLGRVKLGAMVMTGFSAWRLWCMNIDFSTCQELIGSQFNGAASLSMSRLGRIGMKGFSAAGIDCRMTDFSECLDLERRQLAGAESTDGVILPHTRGCPAQGVAEREVHHGWARFWLSRTHS